VPAEREADCGDPFRGRERGRREDGRQVVDESGVVETGARTIGAPQVETEGGPARRGELRDEGTQVGAVGAAAESVQQEGDPPPVASGSEVSGQADLAPARIVNGEAPGSRRRIEPPDRAPEEARPDGPDVPGDPAGEAQLRRVAWPKITWRSSVSPSRTNFTRAASPGCA